jgi:hypothetical protein
MDKKIKTQLIEMAESVIYNLESDDTESALPWAQNLVEELRKIEREQNTRKGNHNE